MSHQDDTKNQAIAENQPAARRDDSVLERGQSIEVVSSTTSWQGSLPPPAEFRQYGNILSSSPQRIMQMVEAQASHRIQAENHRIQQEDRRIQIEDQRVQIEKTVVIGESKRGYLGVACAFILSLLMTAIGAYAIIWGNPWAGVAVIGVQTVGLASAFIYGTNARRRERERKAADYAPRRD